MELKKFLHGVDLFGGLSDDELNQIAEICTKKTYKPGEYIAKQGEIGDELYVITQGFAEVVLGAQTASQTRIVISLGSGQIIGEMALLDQGPRSASIRASGDPTIAQVINRVDFETLCQKNTNIGYVVMRNLAADLSFKLRVRNLSERWVE